MLGEDEKLPTSSVSGAFMLGDVNITQARQQPDCSPLELGSLFSYRCLNSLCSITRFDDILVQ